MNFYLYSNPDSWMQIPSAWNYCLVGVDRSTYRVGPDGWTERLDGEPLYVVHARPGRFSLGTSSISPPDPAFQLLALR